MKNFIEYLFFISHIPLRLINVKESNDFYAISYHVIHFSPHTNLSFMKLQKLLMLIHWIKGRVRLNDAFRFLNDCNDGCKKAVVES